MSELRTIKKNKKKGWMIISFNFFEKIALDPSLLLAPYLPHIFSLVRMIWNLMVVPTMALQTFLYFKGKDAMIKNFKLEIVIYFNSLIINHWTTLHQTPNIFSTPLSNQAIFVTLETLGGRLQFVLSFRNKATICEDSISFEFLNDCLLAS
jgi:hypothetical protein